MRITTRAWAAAARGSLLRAGETHAAGEERGEGGWGGAVCGMSTMRTRVFASLAQTRNLFRHYAFYDLNFTAFAPFTNILK